MSWKSYIKNPITYRTIKNMEPQETWYISSNSLRFVLESKKTIFILFLNEPFSKSKTHISDIDIFNSNKPSYDIPISCINPWEEYDIDNSETGTIVEILSINDYKLLDDSEFIVLNTEDEQIIDLDDGVDWFKEILRQDMFAFFNMLPNMVEDNQKI
jgi:hypothetical protein